MIIKKNLNTNLHLFYYIFGLFAKNNPPKKTPQTYKPGNGHTP